MDSFTPIEDALRERPQAIRPTSCNANDAPDNPHKLAYGFLWSRYPGGPDYWPVFWREGFHERIDGAYCPVLESELRSRLADFCRAEFIAANEREVEEWERAGQKNIKGKKCQRPSIRQVTKPGVGNVVQAITGICLLSSTIDSPAWIRGATGPATVGLVAVKNGIVDLAKAAAKRNDRLMPPTPHFFTANSLPFNFDPNATNKPIWDRFLLQAWQDDEQSKQTLREMFGYMISSETKHQKMFFLVGPKRSGKGTICRVLRQLIGINSVCNPTLGSLSEPFGLEPLIGKSAAIISDARMSGRPDSAIVTERLLSISGEDAITQNRKHRTSISGKLGVRFVIASNELPRLADASGALTSRLILLSLTRSWYGEEDVDLFEQIRPELPAILLWAIEGWRTLNERGKFIQPESGADFISEMEDLSSPIGAFIRDCCIVEDGAEVEIGKLYREWERWCEQHGRKSYVGTTQSFGRDLRSAIPTLQRIRPRRDDGERPHCYVGIRFLPAAIPV